MEPRIQYAKTSDGVNIAWASMGAGPPVLFIPAVPFSWLGYFETFGPNLFAPLTEKHRLIVYDSRGTGFSDRDSTDFSMGAVSSDLDAVVAKVGPEILTVGAFLNAVPLAITYAANHSSRVSRL